jgi:hypothetical protein
MIVYVCFFYAFSVFLHRFQHALNLFGKWYESEEDREKYENVMLISVFQCVFFTSYI